MTTYTRNEIISSSKASKKFGEILEKLKSGKTEKIIISKNNELEAAIIPIEEFEAMKEAYEIVEHLEIYRLINERKGKKATKTLDSLILESGFGRKELEEE
ncbi:MAG: type II toxin-antitoxin system Phd/YefM family antitoxin [Actinobacteria bacterium]|nr:type II toxin-antitoxin system Phd/YefM family antitoxin [Actinomycetota bacterium]MBM3712080.1 type II toxin-antitoxin system Phd/YefM family antitoxin [Actinomycetota bacterium]